MTNDDLKRFYPQNSVPEKRNDFVRYDENGQIPGAGGGGSAEVKHITISATEQATQGNLTQEQIDILLESDINYIVLNNELYRLNDKRVESGYLIYSHACHDNTQDWYLKCITITLNNLTWVLNSINLASKQDIYNAITVALNTPT